VAAHSSNAAPSAGLHALGDPIHDAHELGREAIPVVFPQRNFVSVGAHLASQLKFSQQLQDRVSGFQDHQSTGAGGVRPPRPPQSAGASRSGAPSTDSGVGTQNHDGPGPTQLACARGGNEAATKHLHDIGISNIVDVRTAVVKKASSGRMRSPGPIPRRGFLAAKPALGRCIASDANGDSLAARAGLRHPLFMPYPKDRSTPRAASSSPSGPTMIIVETP